MTLRLHFHPFSSYCQKVLIALYERDVSFEKQEVDLSNPKQRAELTRLWPLSKFPVLVDEVRGGTVAESSIIVEYLDHVHAGPPPMIPVDPAEALEVRLWDRVFDNQIETPLQKVVIDCFRPEDRRDPHGVEEAKAILAAAYTMIDRQLTGRQWATGAAFTLADCAAAPALFYANIIVPFGERPNLQAYFRRLLARPSFARAVEEAKPYRAFFPLGWPAEYP